MRAPCQQPHDSHMAAAALGLGLVCAAPQLAQVLHQHLGEDPWPAMRRWHGAAIKAGLHAPEPSPGLSGDLLGAIEQALERRGMGEEVYAQPLRQRLQTGLGPAQEAALIFAEGGAAALVAYAALR